MCVRWLLPVGDGNSGVDGWGWGLDLQRRRPPPWPTKYPIAKAAMIMGMEDIIIMDPDPGAEDPGAVVVVAVAVGGRATGGLSVSWRGAGAAVIVSITYIVELRAFTASRACI